MAAFRILVVDDEEDIVASLGGLLRDEGYEVISAGSGEDGLSKAVGVDLVVLDLMLPGIDGLETLKRIKERDAGLPVIMMSGHGTVAEAVEAVRAGAYDFLQKPLSGEKVLVTVENALEWRRLEQKNEELEDRVRQRTTELEETNRTVQTQNELLEEQNRRLRVERAVERVRGEVRSMRRTEDLQKAVAVMRGELRELGIDWDPCRIDVEEETGTLRLVVEWDPSERLSFSEEEIGILERFAEVVSIGYTRFLDLQAREERRRALAREAALERVRAEVTVMDGPEDLETVVALMVRELGELSVPADAFVFAVMDEDTRTVRAYGGTPQGWYGMREDSFETSPEWVEIWKRGEPVMRPVDPTFAQEIREGAQRMGWKGEDVGAPPKVALDAPFSHGLISINSARVERFSDEDIQILTDFAEMISLGYARFLDFQRIERERALERVRAEVMGMRSTDDMVNVAGVLWEGLHDVGLVESDVDWCSIDIVDEEENRQEIYAVGSALLEEQYGIKPLRRDIASGVHCYHTRWPTWREPQMLSKEGYTEEERAKWAEFVRRAWDMERREGAEIPIPKSRVTVSFSHGTLTMESFQSDRFSQQDVQVLEGFADAVSLAYARFLDFQRIERERALERIRAEVMAMRSTDDMVNVAGILWEGLHEVGLVESDTDYCSFVIVDEKENTAEIYGVTSGAFQEQYGVEPLRRDIAPGVHCYHTRWPLGEEKTTWRKPSIWSTEHVTEEARAEFAENIRRVWHGEMREDADTLKSGVIVPFSHGVLNMESFQPNRFSRQDVQVLEGFADVVSLAYARFLDFQRLEEQNRALEEANQQIQEANRAKSEFLAKMSHELRTPMNSILGFADLMKDGIFGEIPETFEEPIDEIHKSGDHLLELINDVLDLSKIEAGRMKLDLSECALEGCVESVAATMRPLAEKKGLEMVTAAEEDLPTCKVDESRITQVLLNLAGNAVKFTEQGEVEIGVRRQEEDLFLWVRDTGIGIPLEKQEEIFTEFSQVGTVLTREKEGTGLGLSISKHIVEMHGGEIGVESEEGKGSTFWFRIPREAQIQS